MFTKSGSLTTAFKTLRDKALGAMFSLIRNINKHRTVDPAILLDLFDKLVVPIALYNSEIWGTSFLPQNPNVPNLIGNTALSRHSIENLHHIFLKILLGVPTRTANWAVISETGRYPLALRAWEGVIKYWHHVGNTQSSILSAALSTNVYLHKEGHTTWFSYLERILKYFNLEYLHCILDERELSCQIGKTKGILQQHFKTKWIEDKSKFQTNGKLELFTSLLGSFGFSEYLSKVTNPKHRIAITRMRVSAHKFPIEHGRYLKTTRADRECSLGCRVLGDEIHYMTNCSHPFIKEIITPALNKINDCDNSFERLDSKHKTNYMLMSSDPKILSIVDQLCFKVHDKFKELTF